MNQNERIADIANILRIRAANISDGGAMADGAELRDIADRLDAAAKREVSKAAEDAASKAILDRTAKDAMDFALRVMKDNKAASERDYGPRFFVFCIGEDKHATRSALLAEEGRPLTRRELYNGRMEKAECEYAHAFMCCGFPRGKDPDRPTEDEWLDQEPFEFEVDEFVTEKLFGTTEGGAK